MQCGNWQVYASGSPPRDIFLLLLLQLLVVVGGEQRAHVVCQGRKDQVEGSRSSGTCRECGFGVL